MEFIEKFKNYLFSTSIGASKVTVKNYLADVKQFISWVESTYKNSFNPHDITIQVIQEFKKQKQLSLSARSVDRHLSSLRKFFTFLKLNGDIPHSPFDIQTKSSEALAKEDPYHLHDFKNFLYIYNASHLTIKNYVIDVKQFLSWAEEVLGVHTAWNTADKNVLGKIDSRIVEEYRERLLEQHIFSPASINRKLSSLRKYLTWAGEQGYLSKAEEYPISNTKYQISNSGKETKTRGDARSGSPAAGVPLWVDVGLSSGRTPDKKLDNTIQSQRQYSKIPPIRLFQKITKAGTLAFDALITIPVAHLFKKVEHGKWILGGKKIFTTNPKFQIPRYKKISNFKLKIKNFPKEFFAPHTISTKDFPWYKKVMYHLRYTRPTWYRRYHQLAIAHYFNWAVLIIFATAIGFGMYNSFFTKSERSLAQASIPNAPFRVLSFQGRLTDANNNPITTPSWIRFIIYNTQSSSGSARLWEEVDKVTPDSDGIFSTLLGSDGASDGGAAALCSLSSPATGACGISSTVFSQYNALWLGVSVEATAELTPREQLATVAFADNSEFLQGMPPINATGSGTQNVILALNSAGNLAIGASTTFQSTSGTFTLSGNTVAINTNAGSAGDISLSPDGMGYIDVNRPIRTTTNNSNIASIPNSVEVDSLFGVLATSSGQSAFTLVQNGAGPIISASSGATPEFTVANNGAITDNAYTGNNNVLYGEQGTGIIKAVTTGLATQCLLSSQSGNNPGWGNCAAASNNYWQLNTKILSPADLNNDLAVGGNATSSAKFQVFAETVGPVVAGTASTSGNLTFSEAHGTNPAINVLNGNSLNFDVSPNGDSGTGYITALTLSNNANAISLSTSSNNPLSVLAGTGTITLGTNSTGGNIQFFNSTNTITNAGLLTIASNLNVNGTTETFGAAGTVQTTSNNNLSLLAGNGNVILGTNGSSGQVQFFNNSSTITNSGNLTLAGTITLPNSNIITGLSNFTQVSGGISVGGATTFNIDINGNATLNTLRLPITGGIDGYWNLASGVIAPSNIQNDLVVGGTATTSARFHAYGTVNQGTTPGASISAKTSFATLVIDNTGVGDLFTASTSGNPQFTIQNSGTIKDANYINDQGILYANASGIINESAAPGALGLCLTSGTGGNPPAWLSCSSASSNYWQLNAKVLSPVDLNNDLAIGGNGTSSAKFQVFAETVGADTAGLASTSGGITFTGTIASNVNVPFNYLNGTNLVFQRSPGNDGALTAVLTLDRNGNATFANNVTINGTTETIGNGSASTIGTTNANLNLNSGSGVLTLNNGGTGNIDFFNANNFIDQNGNFTIAGNFRSPITGGISGYWQLSSGATNYGVLAPTNIQNDLAIGGNATSSAKFQVFGQTYTNDFGSVPAGTASTSGGLTFLGAAGSKTTFNIDMLNQSNLSFNQSVGADKGITASTPLLYLSGISGDVGIGTNNPTSPLQIAFDSGTTPDILLGKGNNVANYISFNGGRSMFGVNTTTNSIINAGTGKAIEFWVNGTNGTLGSGTEAMFITSLGSVGINTITPLGNTGLDIEKDAAGDSALVVNQKSLDVNGDVFTASSSGTPRFTIANNGTITATSTAQTTNAFAFADSSLTTGNLLNVTPPNPNITGNIINVASANHTYMDLTNQDLTIGGHKNMTSINGVKKVFVYDTSKDTDGGSWTNDDRAKNSSWYNEAATPVNTCIINTNKRCGAAAFPKKAIIVVATNTLYIFDAKDNSLWMEFDTGSAVTVNMIGPTAGSTLDAVFALNGEIYVGSIGSSASFFIINFKTDSSNQYGNQYRLGTQNIKNRNSADTYLLDPAFATVAILNGGVSDISAAVINGQTYFAAAASTGGGNGSGAVTVINESTLTLVGKFGPSTTSASNVWLTSTGDLYALVGSATSSPATYILKAKHNIQNITGSPLHILFDEVYGYRDSTHYGASSIDNNTFSSINFTAGPSATTSANASPSALFVTQGTSTVDGKSNTIYIGWGGSGGALSVIQEKQGDPSNGSIKYYTNTYISEDMVGDVRGMYPLDANVSAAGGRTDVSAQANNLTNGATAPTYTTSGVRNQAANLGASAAQAHGAGNLLLSAGSAMSVSAWVDPTTLTTTAGTREMWVSADANTASKVSWGIGTKGDGTNANIYCFANGSSFVEMNTTLNAVVNTWYHVALTSDGTNLKCYVNGLLTAVSTIASAETPTQFDIGATQATTAFNAVRGNVDEVEVAASTFTNAEIARMYQVGYRALQNHGAQTLRGNSIAADASQELANGNSNVSAAAASMQNGQIYVGTSNGGISVLGMDSDSLIDVYNSAGTTTDDTGTSWGVNNNFINSISLGQSYGSGMLLAFGSNNGTGNGGTWMESNDTTLKDFFATNYNPFGTTLEQSNLNVDSIFRVTNQLSTSLDNLAIGATSSAALADVFRIDNYGNLFSHSLIGNANAMQFQDPSGNTLLNINTNTLSSDTVTFNQPGPGNIITASDSGALQFQVTAAGNVIGRKFTDLDNQSYFIDPAAAGSNPSASVAGSLTFDQGGTHNINLLALGGTTGNLNIQRSVGGDAGLTSSLYIQGSTGNVGISTNAPTQKLDVVGDAQIGKDATTWGVANYLDRRQITIANTSGQALISYQVKVIVDTASLVTAGKLRSDCKDTRFTDIDGATTLSYWRESGCNSNATTYWVNVPSIPGPTKTIYLYYNNASETTDNSNTNTFSSSIGNLQASYRLDEPIYNPINDYSGNGNTASASGTTVSVGKINNARTFNGSTDYILASKSATLAITGALSIEAWVNTSAASGAFHGIVGRMGGGSGTYSYALRESTTGKAEFFVSGDGTTATKLVDSATTINTGAWVHLVGVYNPSAANGCGSSCLQIYVNGALDGTFSTTVPASLFNSISNVTIGSTYTTPSEFWNGSIDQVNIYNTNLSASQIASLYGSGGAQYGYATQTSPNTAYIRSYVNPEPSISSLGQEQTTLQQIPSFYVQATTGDVALGTTSVASTSALFTVAGDVKSGVYDPTNWGGNFTNWQYRDRISIDNTLSASTSANANYQVHVTANTLAPIAAGKMRSDCNDVRFSDADGNTSLTYWIETGCNTTSTIFWVKVPLLPVGEKKNIYMYYGNPSQNSVVSTTGVFNETISNVQLAYHFDETSGGTATDYSGQGNNGTATGTTVIGGVFNNARLFNGSSDFISASSPITGTGAFTISAWIRGTKLNSRQNIIQWGPNTNDAGVFFFVNTNAKAECDASTHTLADVSAVTVLDGQWHYVACTYTGSGTHTFQVYVDGVPSGPTDATQSLTLTAGSGLFIGKDVTNTDFLAGSMDEPRVYNALLTNAQIGDIYAKGNQPGNVYGYVTTNSAGNEYLRAFENPEPGTSVDTEQDPSQVNTTLYVSNTFGRVGIGTANPGSELQIEGTANGQDLFSASSSGTTQFVIQSGGNVGIGTTSPGATLNVVGTWQGSTYINCPVDPSSNNYTITNAVLGYFLCHNTGGLNSSTTDNWNITGLTNEEGAFMMLHNSVNRIGISTASVTTNIVKINGTQISSVATSNGTGAETDTYNGTFMYMNGAWRDVGNYGPTTNGDLADLAENMNNINPNIPVGSLVTNIGNVSIGPTTKEYDQKAISIISTHPNTIYGPETASTSAVALAGRVPAIVTSLNGPIQNADSITSSPFEGIGMKPSKPTKTIGDALESFDPHTMICADANSLDSIVWPDDDGSNPAKPCFKVPVSSLDATTQATLLKEYHLQPSDYFYVGKVMVYVQKGYSDPDTYLTSTGDFYAVDASLSADFTVPHYYSLFDGSGNPVTRMGAFLELAIGNVRAGSVQAQQVLTNSLAISTANVSIAGQSLHDYIASVVTQMVNSQSSIVNSPVASVDQLHAGIISPLSDNPQIAIRLNNSGIEIAKDASSSAVASIDNNGNATFSGTLNSGNLAVNGDATVSGTLYANNIKANSIEGLSAVVSTLSAQNITNVTNIFFATPSAIPTPPVIATGLGNPSSSGSGLPNSTFNLPSSSFASIASYSSYFAYVPNLNATTGIFQQGLVSLGPTSLSDTSITGQLSIGSQLILADTSINVLGSDFAIQPLRQGGVNFEGGLIAINTNGDLTVNGNTTIKGNLYANVISPLANQDLTVSLSNPEDASSSNHTANFIIHNASSSAIFAVNQLGDLAASGAATIGKLNFSLVAPALALSDTEVVATGSAGTASIKPYQREVTIDDPNVTTNSLIYITPVGSTQTPYLERQISGTSFSVGISTPAVQNVNFNWLIVN